MIKAWIMPTLLCLAACDSTTRPDAPPETSGLQNSDPAITKETGPGADRDLEHGGPWVVRVPGGTLKISVDTVASSGPVEQTLADVRKMLDDPGDGAPIYRITIWSSSPKPFGVRWHVQGKSRIPQALAISVGSKRRPENHRQIPFRA